MSRRGTLGPTVLAGVAGAGLATAAATRTWAEARTRETGLRTEVASGVDVAPLVLPLALVALAAWGTVLVLRRRGRRVVAALGLLAAAGAGLVAAVRAGRSAEVAVGLLGASAEPSTSTSAWPWVAVAGAVVSAAASGVALAHAPAWPEMGSRYDAPGPASAGPTGAGGSTGAAGGAPAGDAGARDMWKAIDAGQDPTL